MVEGVRRSSFSIQEFAASRPFVKGLAVLATGSAIMSPFPLKPADSTGS